MGMGQHYLLLSLCVAVSHFQAMVIGMLLLLVFGIFNVHTDVHKRNCELGL